MSLFLGIDVATTSTVAILGRLADEVVAIDSRPVTFCAPRAGWAQEDPEAWTRIVADALEAPLQTLKGHPGSCLGAAWTAAIGTAAIGTGATEDWGAVSAFVTRGAVVEPRAERAGVYAEGHRRYRRLDEDNFGRAA